MATNEITHEAWGDVAEQLTEKGWSTKDLNELLDALMDAGIYIQEA